MTTTLSTRIQMGALLAATLSLSACASTTPRWDKQFSESVRATMASQVANPAAVGNPDPVNGIDGPAALAAHQRYERSFAQPQSGSNALAPMVGTK